MTRGRRWIGSARERGFQAPNRARRHQNRGVFEQTSGDDGQTPTITELACNFKCRRVRTVMREGEEKRRTGGNGSADRLSQ